MVKERSFYVSSMRVAGLSLLLIYRSVTCRWVGWPRPLTVLYLRPRPQGHETSAHRADSDGSVLLPQTPAVRGLGRSPEARTAAVTDC